MRWIVILLAVMALVPAGQAKSYYNTATNSFGGLFPYPGMTMAGRYRAIDGDCLVEVNATMATAITLDTMPVSATAYRYQLRLANRNNKQGKTRSVKDPATGGTTTLTATQWGLVFNSDDEGNYYAVVLSCDNSNPFDDIADMRSMSVSLIQSDGAHDRQLAATTLTRGVSLEDGFNTLSVDVDGGHVAVAIGKDELHQVLEADVTPPAGPVRVGYMTGGGARVAIERAVLTIGNEEQVTPAMVWTLDALDGYLATSTDPLEGFWTYLDRDMQDQWLRLGGRYTLAVVRAGDGYDLVYIDGAQVKHSLWRPGMLKGHIKPTPFTGNYDLMWIDATMEPIDKDAYATVENGIILTLQFPIYKSQLRLYKEISH